MSEKTFTWPYCRITKIIDGDTVEVEIDTGFHTVHTERVRLLGVNCPELFKGTERGLGAVARDFTTDTIIKWAALSTNKEWPFTIITHKTDSFGRYLADVLKPNSTPYTLSQAIIESGNGVPFMV